MDGARLDLAACADWCILVLAFLCLAGAVHGVDGVAITPNVVNPSPAFVAHL
jgi:hypothetical protein